MRSQATNEQEIARVVPQEEGRGAGSRLLFLDALRAVAALMILWHHFALYPPLSQQAQSLMGPIIDWFCDYLRPTQVFFVIGGFVMARSMDGRNWTWVRVRGFILQRYCRLGLPYAAAIVLAVAACALGRGWLPEEVVGAAPSLAQVMAHAVFAQELLGFEHFSAGLWFVCINFQLGLVYVGLLYLRDGLARLLGVKAESAWLDTPMLLGWPLAVASLFYFNIDAEWDIWALYFFPFFFMGILLHRVLRDARLEWMLYFYLVVVAIAMGYEWRWRLAGLLAVGLLIFVAGKTGFYSRWPRNRVIARLGRISYSLFLVHFPVLVLVAAIWARLGWSSPLAGLLGMLAAFAVSIAVAQGFYCWIEVPASNMSGQLTGGQVTPWRWAAVRLDSLRRKRLDGRG